MKKLLYLILLIMFLPVFALSNNQTILVTSSTGALGSVIAKTLADKGYNLILAGRDTEKLNKLKASLPSKIKIDIIQFDYNDLKQIKLAVDGLKDQSIDGMVVIPPRPYFNTKKIPEAEEWRANFESVFIGPLELIKNVATKMKALGSIVIISGETSKYYLPNYPNTNVIRLMWSGEIKNLCYQYSDNSIRINAISPGIILTEHHKQKIAERAKIANKNYDEQLSFETKDFPSKKYGEPEDVASTVAFLLNIDSKHINCENITLNGGANNSY